MDIPGETTPFWNFGFWLEYEIFRKSTFWSGLKIGDIYEVIEKGKSVKNPQTGMMMELPGKSTGKIKIDFTGGDNPQNEFSMVSFTEGSIDKNNLSNYYIKEIK